MALTGGHMAVSAGVAASSGNALWGSQKCRLVYVKTGYAHVNPLGVSNASVSYGPNGSVSPVFQLANIRIILNTSNNHLKFAGEFGTALSFKIVLHLGEYCYFIADIGSSLFSDFMISPYEV